MSLQDRVTIEFHRRFGEAPTTIVRGVSANYHAAVGRAPNIHVPRDEWGRDR